MREALALSPRIWKIVQNSLGTPEFLGSSSSFQDELGDLLCKFCVQCFLFDKFLSSLRRLISIIALYRCSFKTILLVYNHNQRVSECCSVLSELEAL